MPTQRTITLAARPLTGKVLQRACACGRPTTTAGGECEECRKKREGMLQRAAVNSAPVNDVPPIVHEVLSAPGQPLDAQTRAFMEPRFGHDFSGVRVHTDARAAESARAVDALAYTVGQDVVFGGGQYTPNSTPSRLLLAHELTHTVQQSADIPSPPCHIAPSDSRAEHEAQRAAAGIMDGRVGKVTPQFGSGIQRNGLTPAPPSGRPAAASPVPTLPPLRSFAEMWGEFEEQRRQGRDTEALATARALVGRMLGEESINHAGDLALWLLEHNEWQLAQEALNNLEAAWWIRFVTVDRLPITGAWLNRVGPEELMQAAQQQASSNQHDQAREMFGLAFLFLQMRLILRSDQRFAQLANMDRLPPGTNFPLFRLMSYREAEDTIVTMRRIIGFYTRQQRQAVAAGHVADAQRCQTLDRQLRTRLRERYLIQGTGEGSRAITMEATFDIDRRRGEGFILHGAEASHREEFVTHLPGEPLPDELGRHPAYSASMDELLEDVGGREDFLTEIYSQPQIRAAFGVRPIMMNDLSTRLRVWNIMHSVFQTTPSPGCGTALCSLLRLMERYLRHFTMHTGYNIRDFGVSYLDSEFPEDLLGRATRDCGVYALKVAYEVYRTARQATPSLPVGFQLYHSLEHVVLVIFDQTQNEFYTVSNDQITGPQTGDATGAVSSTFGGLLGRRHGAALGARSQIMNTSLGEAAFRREIWENFKSGALLGLQAEPPTGPGDTRNEAERREASYRRYYDALPRFDNLATGAEVRLDTLVRALSVLPSNEHSATVTPHIEPLTRLSIDMIRILITHILNRSTAGLRPGATRPIEQVGFIGSAGAGVTHPVVRAAMALLYAERLGLTLTADQQAIINWVRNAPWLSFGRDLSQYLQRGRPSSF